MHYIHPPVFRLSPGVIELYFYVLDVVDRLLVQMLMFYASCQIIMRVDSHLSPRIPLPTNRARPVLPCPVLCPAAPHQLPRYLARARPVLHNKNSSSVGILAFSLKEWISYIAGILMICNAAFNFYVIFKVNTWRRALVTTCHNWEAHALSCIGPSSAQHLRRAHHTSVVDQQLVRPAIGGMCNG